MRSAGGRYPPLLAILAAIFLALAVLPSALNLPQSNPSTTLEYAPVPPADDDAVTPPGGNLSSLGLGSSATLVGGADGVALPPAAATAGAVGKNPSTKRCIGNPPRQTEDSLSPPCVAYFEGDNFGATYQGVTREEIRILIYKDSEGSCCTSQGNDDEPGDPTYIDLAKPPTGTETARTKALRAFQRYFNERYQTYNRFVHFSVYYTGGGDKTPESRRADAADNILRVKPFAVVAYAVFGNEDAYLEAMASRGVLNFGSYLGRDAAFFQRFPKLIWGYLPSLQIQAKQFSAYLCRKVVPHKVSFSGNTGDMGKPRVLGRLRTSNSSFPGMQRFAALVKRQVEQCGGRWAAERTFEAVNYTYNTGHPDAPAVAAQNMAAFRQEGVTTIVWAQGYETEHPRAGATSGYRPEWVVAGDGTMDGSSASQYQERSSWDHAWTVSNAVLVPELRDTDCYQAVREVDTNMPEQDMGWACGEIPMYQDLRQLFVGIQVAGPRVGPDAIDKGFHAIPAVASSDPGVPACFYERDDYTCVKDAIAMWWDSTGDGLGCWHAAEGGKRYFAEIWPPGDVLAQKSDDDPCNQYAGTYYLFTV